MITARTLFQSMGVPCHIARENGYPRPLTWHPPGTARSQYLAAGLPPCGFRVKAGHPPRLIQIDNGAALILGASVQRPREPFAE